MCKGSAGRNLFLFLLLLLYFLFFVSVYVPNVYYIAPVLIDSEHAQTDIELNFIGLMIIGILSASLYPCSGIL